jgi:hypothetical protein
MIIGGGPSLAVVLDIIDLLSSQPLPPTLAHEILDPFAVSYQAFRGILLVFESRSKYAMTDITHKFPLELLAEILGHASVPDVLRVKQVNGQSLVCGWTY